MSLVAVETTTVERLSIHGVKGAASWEEVASRRRKEIYDAIPSEFLVPKQHLNSIHLVNLRETSGILTARELSITSHSATHLLKLIHDETYTSVEVTKAFCKASAIAHQAVSCFLKLWYESSVTC